MVRKNKLRIPTLILAILFVLSTMLVGCGSGSSSGTTASSEESTAAEKVQPKQEETKEIKESVDKAKDGVGSSYKGKIKFFAQAYNPVEPTETNPNPPKKFKALADEYTKLHPDITIEFVPNPQGQDYKAWFLTKAAGGDLPDIFWHQATDINQLPKDMVTDFTPYLDTPNPYANGQIWGELFRKTIQDETQAPDGTKRLIIGDYVDTLVMYNKELFEKAGISEVPATWRELMEVCKKLKDAGITPYGIDASMKSTNMFAMYTSWFGRVILSNLYANDFDKFIIDNTNGQSPLSKVVAYKKGLIGKKDPRWAKAWWPLVKDFSQYWQKGAFGGGDLPRMFAAQQIAMYQTGSWDIKTMKDLKVSFKYGSFPFPNIDSSSSEYATDAKTSNAAGGPLAAFSYGVSTSKSNKSLTPEKMAAVIDWMMYITTPENNEAVCNELGIFVPTVKGAKPAEELSWIADQMDIPLKVVDGGMMITNDVYVSYGRIFQMYMNNQLSLDEAINRIDGEMGKAADALIKKNPNWEVDKYLK